MKDSKTCKICCKTFTRRNYMLKHMENIHSKRYSCSVCSRFFPGPTEHACAVKDGRFVCYVENCSLRFASGMTLRLHIRDGHKKLDENTASENFKTKKGARDFVKTLCKNINMLTVCFDELRYQVDSMAEFMKTLGYESQIHTSPNPKKKLKTTTEERDYVELNDYIEYIEEELIEEVNDNDDEDMVIEDDEQFTEQPKEEMINTDCKNENSAPEKNSLLNKNSIIVFPKADDANVVSSTNINSTKLLGPIPETTKTEQTTLLKYSSPLVKDKKLINFPTVAKVGSTIIRQLPFEMGSLPNKNINSKLTTIPILNTDTPSSEQSTPPLFLKIQYDNTESEVYKADPKITFHFDTRPPDDEKEVST